MVGKGDDVGAIFGLDLDWNGPSSAQHLAASSKYPDLSL